MSYSLTLTYCARLLWTVCKMEFRYTEIFEIYYTTVYTIHYDIWIYYDLWNSVECFFVTLNLFMFQSLQHRVPFLMKALKDFKDNNPRDDLTVRFVWGSRKGDNWSQFPALKYLIENPNPNNENREFPILMSLTIPIPIFFYSQIIVPRSQIPFPS